MSGHGRAGSGRCVISRQDSHRAETAAVRGLERAGRVRARGMRGRWPAPPAAATATLQPARDGLRDQEEKKKWQEVSLF